MRQTDRQTGGQTDKPSFGCSAQMNIKHRHGQRQTCKKKKPKKTWNDRKGCRRKYDSNRTVSTQTD